MGFHPNDKRSQVIRSKTHTTFFIFLLDKVKYRFYTVCIRSAPLRNLQKMVF